MINIDPPRYLARISKCVAETLVMTNDNRGTVVGGIHNNAMVWKLQAVNRS